MTVIPQIIEQHAEEAAFLWLLRAAAVSAPHYSLSDLEKLDDRVEAHIDGLKIAEDEGWRICHETLSRNEPGEVFTVGVLAYSIGVSEWINEIHDVVLETPKLSTGLISALGWLPFSSVERYILNLVNSEKPALVRTGIGAYAVHRKDPGEVLKKTIVDTDPALRARALRAAGELGRKDLLPLIRTMMNDKDPDCRFAASWSSALLGNVESVFTLRTIADQGGIHAEIAFAAAMRRSEPRDARQWQHDLMKRSDAVRLAIIGAGVIGDPEAVPWLIEKMEEPELARMAGESFSLMTGVDFASEDMDGDFPEGYEFGPTENPEDEDVQMDPEEDLPWPIPERVSDWWSQNKGRYMSGTRYMLGRQMMVDSLRRALKEGQQRQRAAAALELAMKQPEEPLFEVRAPGYRQRLLLS